MGKYVGGLDACGAGGGAPTANMPGGTPTGAAAPLSAPAVLQVPTAGGVPQPMAGGGGGFHSAPAVPTASMQPHIEAIFVAGGASFMTTRMN